MGIYSEYINKPLTFEELSAERKKYLKKISELRGRDVLVYASDAFQQNAQPMILPNDLLPFKDQLGFVKSKDIDIIIETPGGIAETVEDMVKLVHSKFERVGIIIPGTAKSAGTIFSMSGDEILMGETSSLGPIDAQVINNNKRFSADAFLDGLEKIKEEVLASGKLNPAYIPMLQNISPGEIQHCENAQNFSKILVKTWLTDYKFKYWEKHSSTGIVVTDEEKINRADEIASKLCKHSEWLTHGRSLRKSDLSEMGLQINDYSQNSELNDAIERYFTLLKIIFDRTSIYKIFETVNSQIYLSAKPVVNENNIETKAAENVLADINCPKCTNKLKIHLPFRKGNPTPAGAILYPKNDILKCPKCGNDINISSMRLQIEAQFKSKVQI